MRGRGVTRHFTATGFVVRGESTLLHWHPKVKAWLPPGGHIEPNEDPAQAALREIFEETGARAEVVGGAPDLGLAYPRQAAPPFTIMIEDIEDPAAGAHQHIDFIYFCRWVGQEGPLREGWRWTPRWTLAEGVALETPEGGSAVPPEDVRLLAEQAFRAVTGWRATF